MSLGEGAADARGDAPSRDSRASSPSASTRATKPGVRTRSWVKVKSVGAPGARDRRLDARQGPAQPSIGALLLGVHEPRRRAALRRARRQRLQRRRARASVRRLLAPLERSSSPFRRARRRRAGRLLRAAARRRGRVREWTAAGSLRHRTYKGLRERQGRGGSCARTARSGPRARRRARAAGAQALALPAGAETARPSSVGGRELKLSNLDKVLYPSVGFDQARRDRLLRDDRTGPARPPADRAR